MNDFLPNIGIINCLIWNIYYLHFVYSEEYTDLDTGFASLNI